MANQKSMTPLALILVSTFSAYAAGENVTLSSSRQINQDALSCLHPGNCVTSFSSYGLEALVFTGRSEQAMDRLKETLAHFPEAQVVSRGPHYLEVIFTTALGFKDQVEFYIDEPSQRIDFRSRSKLGLYDFNKNRSRMQDFTIHFKKLTVNAEKPPEN